MNPGDRVNWSYTPQGGYGYTIKVAGVVVKLTNKRATIKVSRKVAGQWKQEEKSVSLDKLTPRMTACPELGE